MVVMVDVIFIIAFGLGIVCMLYSIFEIFERAEQRHKKELLEARLRRIRENRGWDRDEGKRE